MLLAERKKRGTSKNEKSISYQMAIDQGTKKTTKKQKHTHKNGMSFSGEFNFTVFFFFFRFE